MLPTKLKRLKLQVVDTRYAHDEPKWLMLREKSNSLMIWRKLKNWYRPVLAWVEIPNISKKLDTLEKLDEEWWLENGNIAPIYRKSGGNERN